MPWQDMEICSRCAARSAMVSNNGCAAACLLWVERFAMGRMVGQGEFPGFNEVRFGRRIFWITQLKERMLSYVHGS